MKTWLLCLVDSLSMDIITFLIASAEGSQLDSLFGVLEFIFLFSFLPLNMYSSNQRVKMLMSAEMTSQEL